MKQGEELVHAPDDPVAAQHPAASYWTSLWLHAAALAVVLFALIPVLENGYAALPDEGVYLAQAETLLQGSWSAARTATDVDPDGDFAPVTENGVVGDRVIAYYKHPLYPVLLLPGYAIAGYAGALVMSVLGTWAAAVAAGLIGREFGPRVALLSLWIAGVGSPLVFDAYVVIAHSLAAAAAGFAFYGTSRALSTRSLLPLCYALPSVAALVAMRSEGLILAVALGLSVAAMAVGWPPLRQLDRRSFCVGAAVVTVGISTYVLETLAAKSIRGSDAVSASPAARLDSEALGVIRGIWSTLLRPFAQGWESAQMFVPITACFVLLAALILRVAPRRTLLPTALLVAAAGVSLGLLVSRPELVTGLVAAFPVLLAGLLLLPRKVIASPVATRALLTSAMTTVVVLAVNYEVGGNAEWGGRFLHVLIPILVPLAAAGLESARRQLPFAEGVVASCCVLLISMMLSVGAVRALIDQRSAVSSIVENTISYIEDGPNGDDPAVIIARFQTGEARFFWSDSTSLDLLNAPSFSLMFEALRAVDATDRNTVVLASNYEPDVTEFILADAADELGWTIDDVRTSDERGGTLMRLSRTGDS